VLADLLALLPPPALAGARVVRVRPPERTDLAALERLVNAAAAARHRRPRLRREELELRWLQLVDPHEAVVVLADDVVAAYASASPDLEDTAVASPLVTVYLDLLVNPAWTGHGLGGSLVDAAVEAGRRTARMDRDADADVATTPAVTLRTALTDGSEAERHWFTSRGFQPRRHLLDLHLDLHAPPPAPRWPADVRVRTFRPGDDDDLLWDVHQRAFADVPTHLPIARDDLLRDRDPRADPGLVLLAEHLDASSGAEVVGILIGRAGTEVSANDGWVRDLGVVPAWRRRGIAMALLRTGFAVFRARGLTGVALEVDDVTLDGAVALYRRAGMRITHRTDVLERIHAPAAAADRHPTAPAQPSPTSDGSRASAASTSSRRMPSRNSTASR
jgi:mycothiol synthase